MCVHVCVVCDGLPFFCFLLYLTYPTCIRTWKRDREKPQPDVANYLTRIGFGIILADRDNRRTKRMYNAMALFTYILYIYIFSDGNDLKWFINAFVPIPKPNTMLRFFCSVRHGIFHSFFSMLVFWLDKSNIYWITAIDLFVVFLIRFVGKWWICHGGAAKALIFWMLDRFEQFGFFSILLIGQYFINIL